MATPEAHVPPEVLRWARESIGYEIEAAARKIGVTTEKLANAERGDVMLTLRQAEEAARVYDRELADLFRPTPPREEPDSAQFRRLPGAPEPPWPPAMKSVIRRIRDRQEAAAELYEMLGDEPPWTGIDLPSASDPVEAARAARALLGVSLEEQHTWQTDVYAPLRAWIDAVENLGIFVMQDGTQPVEVMRGFASTHRTVPVIVANTKDDPRARAFTIIHEVGHLLPGSGPDVHSSAAEAWCNRFAAEVLMPSVAFRKDAPDLNISDPLPRVDRVARHWGVTPLAAAVRALTLGLVAEDRGSDLLEAIAAREPKGGGGGGNYYNNTLARLGPGFVQLVFTAMEGQALTYPAASGLLGGVKVKSFPTLREYLARRSFA